MALFTFMSPRKLLMLGLGLVVAAMAVHSVQTPSTPFDPGQDPDERQLLLHPEALKAAPPVTLEEIRQGFLDPPAEFRTAPLWVWNDEITVEMIKEQLRQFKEQGIGQVFVHPRPGLITEYLGDEWFQLWKAALDEAKQLGMLCHIYDENSYPAGFAGGHVPSLAPDLAVQSVQVRLEETPRNIGGDHLLAAFKVERDGSGRLVRTSRVPEREYSKLGGPVALFSLRRATASPWTGYFPYVDLTSPDSARMFIQTTLEPYKTHFGGEFGKTVRWSFDDEPNLEAVDDHSLPLSFYILAEFHKRQGYDLRDELPSLFWDVGDWRKVRFDYLQTLHDLWKENFFRPLFQWCDRNNLQFTGHWLEHEWPYPWVSPADASFYAYEHMPGIDMLVGAELRQKAADPHMLFTIRQVASAARQLGRQRVLCEAYGVSGWDSTFEHYKRMGDWLIVHGVNLIDQHLSFMTIRGARKRDHPQSFSDVGSWWPYYRLHADHTARLSYVMAEGVAPNRLLVLEPTTSGFLWARRGADNPELAQLRTTYDQLIQFLADHQVDFDLGDEYMIEWFGEARGKQFVIGNASYDLLVWPQGMTNLRHQTLPVLERYLEGGGEILALNPPALYVDGRPSDAAQRLRERFSAQWHSISNLQDLWAEVHHHLPARVTFDKELPPGIGHRMETLSGGGRVHLFTNSRSSNVSAAATVEGAAAEEWDTATGKIVPVAFRSPTPGKIEFTLDLPPAGSRLLHVSLKPKPEETAPLRVTGGAKTLALTEWKVSPASPNVLVLDYCDLQLAGQSFQDINTWRANWLIWQGHGYERPAWDNAIQFRRRILAHPPFPTDSGFEAAFHFRVADFASLPGAHLAMESPELYKVYVNDQPVDISAGKRWLDPHLKSIPVEKLLKVGENTVRLVGSPFDVHMELENIYVRGNFTLQPDQRGFSLHPPRALQLGSWAKQGYPFYYDSVLYEAGVDVSKGARILRISFPYWAGSVAEVLVDGKRIQVIGWQPYACEIPVSPGRHAVGLRVVATPRNLFGPFHDPTKPRMIASPAAWSSFPEHQPPGAQYDQLDYGLLDPFKVEALP
jgi:hypothetical protein